MVARTRQEEGDVSEEVAFPVGSIAPKVKHFARVVRGQWGIETIPHWSLEVTFASDQSRVRKDRGPENLALLRRPVVSLSQQDTSCKAGLRGKRLITGWGDEVLLKILAVFSGESHAIALG